MRKRYFVALIVELLIFISGLAYFLAELPYSDPGGFGPLPEDVMRSIFYSAIALIVLVMTPIIITTFIVGLAREKLDKEEKQK